MNRKKIKEAINEFANNKGLSKNKLSEMMGVSAATLSKIDQEKWEDINDNMFLKIWNCIRKQERFVINTHNFSKVQKNCEYACYRHKMVGLIGSTGLGKTTGLKKYYENNKNTYYISCEKSMTAKQFLSELLRQMGIVFTGTVYEVSQKIADELNKQTNPLIIVDEAGKLSQRVIMYLHDLRNKTENNAGIVLAGVEYFKTNLEKSVNRQLEGMPEFYDRICLWEVLETPKKNEIQYICEAYGITDKETVKSFQKAKNFRRLSNYIEFNLYDTFYSEQE